MEENDYIRIKRNRQTFFVPVSSQTTFLEVKSEISKALNDNTSPDVMKLYRGENELTDAGTCADLEMKCADILYLALNNETLEGVKSES